MLYRDLLQKEFSERREALRKFARVQDDEIDTYLYLLDELGNLSCAEVETRIGSDQFPGALPSAELEAVGNVVAPFNESWRNHEEAREWAGRVLRGRITFAADGSQLYVEKETTLPIGAIQIGWFENPHDPELEYEKNAEFRLLTPEVFLCESDAPYDAESRIGEMRFIAEVEKVAAFLRGKKGWEENGERMPLAFFDGTLLVSFSLPRTVLQKRFVDAMVGLVRISKESNVPLVGYVDRSFSNDVLNLLDAIGGSNGDNRTTVHDATILSAGDSKRSPVLANWGDRSCHFHSRRKGVEAYADEVTGRSLLGFCYLRTSLESPPARVDVPEWIYEKGLLEEVMDVVRAECVIGLGYPYPLETADETAVISNRDRQVFLKALQEFAQREKLNFSVSRKGASKGRRR